MKYILFALLITQSGFISAAESKFTGEQASIEKKVIDLFDVSKKVNLKGSEGKKARTELEASLDWDKVAEVCLGKNYKKQSTQNQTEFRNLLKDVIIRTAYSRLDKFWKGTTYEFDKINVKGNSADTLIKFTLNGEVFSLEYFFNKKAGKWSIYDISYEDIRYSENINEQLDAFLREKKFSDLLEKLKKRRSELDDQNKPA